MKLPETHGRAAFAFIFITVLLDMLALGIIVPVLPELVIHFEGGNAASAARMLGVFGTVWAAMQFLFAPVLGALSDRFGRRPVILVSTLGLGLDYIVMATAPTLGWLFVGRVISGITSASYATGFAYIADVVEEEKRAAKFGMLGAAFGVGFVVGPALGGILGHANLRLPFWVAAGLSLLGTAYGYFVLPESLPPGRRSPFTWRTAHPLGALDFLERKARLVGLGATTFLYRLAHDAMPVLFVIYGDYRYHWNARTVGLVLAGVGVASMIVQGGLVGRAVDLFGERGAMLVGLLSGVASFATFAYAPTGTIFLLGIPLSALFGLTNPAVQGLMTREVSSTEQGRLQGAVASLTGIAGILAPLLFAQVFSNAIAAGAAWHLPGAPFYLAAGMLAVGAFIAARTTRTVPGTTSIDGGSGTLQA